jgi:hypothetical protein
MNYAYRRISDSLKRVNRLSDLLRAQKDFEQFADELDSRALASLRVEFSSAERRVADGVTIPSSVAIDQWWQKVFGR